MDLVASPVRWSSPVRILVTADMFLLESVVRGCHVYKEIWSSVLGEELQCICEIGNVHDLYAVKVVKTGIGTVGHLPKEISMPCHLFLRIGGNIGCTIAGVRQYSVDLPQGGLEIPYKLMFRGRGSRWIN